MFIWGGPKRVSLRKHNLQFQILYFLAPSQGAWIWMVEEKRACSTFLNHQDIFKPPRRKNIFENFYGWFSFLVELHEHFCLNRSKCFYFSRSITKSSIPLFLSALSTTFPIRPDDLYQKRFAGHLFEPTAKVQDSRVRLVKNPIILP